MFSQYTFIKIRTENLSVIIPVFRISGHTSVRTAQKSMGVDPASEILRSDSRVCAIGKVLGANNVMQ
jgi:hypothetical protein